MVFRLSFYLRHEGQNCAGEAAGILAFWSLASWRIKKMDVETVKSFIPVLMIIPPILRRDGGSHPAPASSWAPPTQTAASCGISPATADLAVRVNGNGKRPVWELSDADQIWAEAVARTVRVRHCFWTVICEGAVTHQRDAMESDDREGLVTEYLDTPLPRAGTGWIYTSGAIFLSGGSEFGADTKAGVTRREQVCILEIWCECFCKNRESIKKADSYEIEGILNKIGGWSKFTRQQTAKEICRFMAAADIRPCPCGGVAYAHCSDCCRKPRPWQGRQPLCYNVFCLCFVPIVPIILLINIVMSSNKGYQARKRAYIRVIV